MKLLYRYGNIPITLVLVVYLIESVVQILHHWYAVFFVAVNLAIIISLNKYYIKTYLSFPFAVYADNEKMICKDFLLSRKTLEIKHSQVERISGGIIAGTPTRPVYLYDAHGNILVGFYANSGKFLNLLKTILKNMPEENYQETLTKMKAQQK